MRNKLKLFDWPPFCYNRCIEICKVNISCAVKEFAPGVIGFQN